MKTFLLMLCCVAASHAWNCTEAPRMYNAQQVDAGQGQVVARNTYSTYFLSGSSWYSLGMTRLNHVSVGRSGIWATGRSNKVYKFVAGKFRPLSGISLQQVDAGGDGQVVGIAPINNYTHCLRSTDASTYKGVKTLRWYSLSRRMKYYSCSPNNVCWGVDTSYQVFVTQRVTPSTCSTYNWIRVPGLQMNMIEISSDGSVFGVARDGRVYQRSGILSYRPQGSSWSYVSMCMPAKHVSYDLGRLWMVTTSGLLMVCTH